MAFRQNLSTFRPSDTSFLTANHSDNCICVCVFFSNSILFSSVTSNLHFACFSRDLLIWFEHKDINSLIPWFPHCIHYCRNKYTNHTCDHAGPLLHAQVQGQMGVGGRPWCDFVVYTKKGISADRVPFIETYWNTLFPKLIEIYDSCVLPEIVSPVYAQLDLRT